MVGVVRNPRNTALRTQQRNGLSLCFPEKVTLSWVLENRTGRRSPLTEGWGIFLLDGRNREVGGKKEKEGSGETKRKGGKRQNRRGGERRAKFTRDVELRKTLRRS